MNDVDIKSTDLPSSQSLHCFKNALYLWGICILILMERCRWLKIWPSCHSHPHNLFRWDSKCNVSPCSDALPNIGIYSLMSSISNSTCPIVCTFENWTNFDSPEMFDTKLKLKVCRILNLGMNCVAANHNEDQPFRIPNPFLSAPHFVHKPCLIIRWEVLNSMLRWGLSELFWHCLFEAVFAQAAIPLWIIQVIPIRSPQHSTSTNVVEKY